MIILFVAIFRLIPLFPPAIVDHHTAHINKIVFFSQTRGRGENEIFSKDMEQEEKKRR